MKTIKSASSKPKFKATARRKSIKPATANAKAPKIGTDSVNLSKSAKSETTESKPGVDFSAWNDDSSAGYIEEQDAKEQGKASAELVKSLGQKSLRRGSNGESVEALQKALNSSLGPDAKLDVDGKFGRKTEKALKAFQKKAGLKDIDGIFGKKTLAALTEKLGSVGGTAETKGENPKQDVAEGKPGSSDAKAPAKEGPVPSGYLFGKKLGKEKIAAVETAVSDLKAAGFNVKANDLIGVMASETGGTFAPNITSGGRGKKKYFKPEHGRVRGAVGLNQMTGIAIKELNRTRRRNGQPALTKEKIAGMSFADQMKQVVTPYYTKALSRAKMQGKAISAADLYTANFAPAFTNRSLHSTLYSKSRNRRAYRANSSLDRNRDGKITKFELTNRLRKWMKRG